MKHEKWRSFAIATIISFSLSFASAGCLVTAFNLTHRADLFAIAIWCMFISVFSSLMPTLHLGWITPFFLALLAVILWLYGDMERSMQGLIHTISKYCSEGYGTSVLHWDGINLAKIDRSMAISGIASLVAMFTGWCVCERRTSFWAILIAIIALAPCTLVIFSVPDPVFLFLWLATIVIILLSQSVRIQNEREGNRLTMMLSVPVLIVSLLLFVFVPQDGYDGRERAETMLMEIENFLGVDLTHNNRVQIVPIVDLQDSGDQEIDDALVMKVRSDKKGIYYLRGRSFDVYTGTAWENEGIDLPWQAYHTKTATIHIQTEDVEPILYVPYYSAYQQAQSVENNEETKEYSFDCYEKGTMGAVVSYSYYSLEQLKHLPPKTSEWARKYLQDHFSSDCTPQEIAKHVASSARYDLSSIQMSAEYDDFAQWFLEESDKGYCVHFATATVVLLRANGIPARYVTGYMVDLSDSAEAKVYTTDAHAWVEYWTMEDGWRILESTPSLNQSVQPDELNPTMPSQTEPDTEPTEPTQNAEPSEEVTKPTLKDTADPEASTEPTEPTEKLTQEESTESANTDNETPSTDETQRENVPSYKAKGESNPSLSVYIYIVAVVLFILLVIAQWKIRVWVKLRALYNQAPNELALNYWALIQKYSQLLKLQPSQEIQHLAEKAKFSQHTLTQEELEQIRLSLQKLSNQLKSRPIYKQFYERIIKAFY